MATLVRPVNQGVVPARVRSLPAWTAPVSVAVAVMCRIPFLGHVPGPDEGGFLLVGRQWDGAGTSLYGNYWVDRPPLLITIFRIASAGGLVELRLIGCVAAAALVYGCARVAGLIGGDQAARWAAATAAALSVSLFGYEVNGELLADLRKQPHGGRRMAAQRKKIVLGHDVLHVQQLAPHLGDGGLDGVRSDFLRGWTHGAYG